MSDKSDSARELLREAKDYLEKLMLAAESHGAKFQQHHVETQLLARITAHLAASEQEQWVKCSERLPDVKEGATGRFFIACRRKSGKVYVFQAEYLNEHRLSVDDDDADDDGTKSFTGWYQETRHYEYDNYYDPVCEDGDAVTHWQPLPPLPKDEK